MDSKVFKQTLRTFLGVPYEWGGMNHRGSDCSGTVCAALEAASGKRLRVTADFLYRNLFVYAASGGEDVISAVFFLDEKGKAVHVAGCCGSGLYLNQSRREADQCAHLRTKQELGQLYSDLKMVEREVLC